LSSSLGAWVPRNMGRTSLITRPVEDYTSTLLHYQPQIYTKLLFCSRDPAFIPILRDFKGGGNNHYYSQYWAPSTTGRRTKREAAQKKARRKPGLVD